MNEQPLTNDQVARDDERGRHQLLWGIFFILLGLLFLAERFDLLPFWAADFKWWGILVAAIGLGQLVRPRRANDVNNGVFFLLLGGWFVLASNELYGLTWGNSWPLVLVAGGAASVARTIASQWLPDPRRARRAGHRHV